MTTIGDELKRLIPEGKAQKAVAMEWLDTWRRGHPEREALTTDTVESRLSECLKNRPPGIKFFFSSPARRETTFETFGVSQPGREQLNQLADGVLSTERPVRLIVDVSAGPQASAEAEAMLASIKQRFLGEDTLFPMVLVLTDQQYDRLPRSFDDLKDRLTVEKVPTAAAGQALAKSLAGTEALLVSPHPQLPFERWAALRLDTPIRMEPPDALALFRTDGALPGLPPVTRPLARIVDTQDSTTPNGDAIAIRKLMLALAGGEHIPDPDRGRGWQETLATPERRQAWAHALGIEAAATPQEWVDALPKRIAPVEIFHAHLFPLWLSLAHHDQVGSVAFRRGQVLHLINPPEPVRAEIDGLTGIEVHDIQPLRRGRLDSLMREASTLSRDDLLDDPFLEQLVARHGDEVDEELLQRARSALILSRVLQPERPTLVADFRPALLALLDGTELEARMRFEITAATVEIDDRPYQPFVVPRAYLDRTMARGPQARLSPMTGVTLRRGEELAAVRFSPIRSRSREGLLAETCLVAVPRLEGAPSGWAEDLLRGLRINTDPSFLRPLSVRLPDWYAEELTVSESEWASADRELAFLLGALRAAANVASPLSLPSGAVLLALGNGIFAEIHARQHARSEKQAPVATLLRPLTLGAISYHDRELGWSIAPLTHLVPLYTAQTSGYTTVTTELGARLPHGIDLSGRGFRAEITFHASPLFAAMPVGVMLESAAAAGGAALDKAKRDDDQRRRDDDDDD